MSKIKVFIIQHKTPEAEAIKQLLLATREASFFVSHSPSITHGVVEMKQDPFDIIILDLGLPDREGIDPVFTLRKEFPLVPIVALAGSRDEALVTALQHGVHDYLIKDRITPDLLVRTIRYSIERNQMALENAGLIKVRGKLEAEIRQLLNNDSLAAVQDKRLYMDRIALERDRASRQGKKMALLALDLDWSNEIKGQDAGNMLLQEAASRFKSLLRKSDMVSRTGLNELGIILPDIVRPEDTADVARNILNSLQKSFHILGHEFLATACIGISIYPDDGRNVDSLLTFAGDALREARDSGRNHYRFIDHSLYVKAEERMNLENQIRRSLESGELMIHYQPLVDISTRRIVCAEALARWRHPEKGLLSPIDFIPAAEEAGLISAIDEWVLRAVCRQAKSWLDSGLQPICVTVNLSARQLQDPDLVRTVTTVLSETGVPAGSLYFEITEKTAMSDAARTAERLYELAALGIHISIDDFGTGYSSVNQLERLPIERLKIDKSFIHRVPADPDNRTIVRSVTSLAHNMRMKVVAEGVETEAQLTFLRSIGCDEMQGYLFSKPLPAEEFERLMTARKRMAG